MALSNDLISTARELATVHQHGLLRRVPRAGRSGSCSAGGYRCPEDSSMGSCVSGASPPGCQESLWATRSTEVFSKSCPFCRHVSGPPGASSPSRLRPQHPFQASGSGQCRERRRARPGIDTELTSEPVRHHTDGTQPWAVITHPITTSSPRRNTENSTGSMGGQGQVEQIPHQSTH